MNYSLLFVTIAVTFGFFALPVLSQEPVLDYAVSIDLSDKMANVTPATQDIPVNVFYKLYYTVDGADLHIGIVCNGSSITGQNVDSYCGIGWSKSNDSVPGMLGADGVAGYVDSNGNAHVVDLILNGRSSDINQCQGGASTFICADADKNFGPKPCKSDVTSPSGRRQGDYLIFEFTRKLNTGDTTCDSQIVAGVGIPVIFSIGLVDTKSSDTYPYNMLPHEFGTNVIADHYYVDFHVVPPPPATATHTEPTAQTTSDSGSSSSPATTSSQETSSQKSSGSNVSLLYSLIGFSTLFAIRLL